MSGLNKRAPTGIEGFDGLIEGGFLRGDVILLAGGPGSGKTIFSTQFICHGATECGEKGVFATFEEDAPTLRRNMLRLGFDLEKLERQGTVKVLDLEALKGDGISANVQFILDTLQETGAKRLVIDSLTAFFMACPEKFEYRALMHLIYRMLKANNITTIMTCSMPLGAATLGLGIEEFVADSVIVFDNVIDNMELKTRLLVRKMRGTDHSKKYHNVLLTDKGMQIVPFTIT
jgi:circadian clock protein KaiC